MHAFMQNHPEIVLGHFLLSALVCICVFYWGGKKAERLFAGGGEQVIRFRERGASGYSNRSIWTRLGSANRVLEVTATERELWIRGIWPMFTYIGKHYDLTHRVPHTDIREVRSDGNRVTLRFRNETGGESNVVLILRDVAGLLAAIKN